ncbi:TraI domain-containing protein [Candidatus Bipolaricaulota bacterium]|nr:TraI domain-containing protein [Candidatus Bipolaricaulota bacterium]
MPAERFSERVRGEVPYSLLHIPISDLRDGQQIGQCFLVKQKTQRSTRSGDPYLEILLADRTGTIPARAWADAAQRYANQFDEGEFAFVEGRSETYRGNLQLIVSSIRRLSSHEKDAGQIQEFDPALLVPASNQDVGEMWGELLALVEGIEPTPLKDLTSALLQRHEAAFKEFPAAISKHHAYIGGLLEHTLEVARGAIVYAQQQPALGLHAGLVAAG